jgi:hypothetical protein
MKMLTVMRSRILASKAVSLIHPHVRICYLRKFIIVLDNTLVRFIGFRRTENSIRNMKFIMTIGTNMKLFPHIVSYVAESDDVT